MTLTQYLKERAEKRQEARAKLIGLLISPLIYGLILVWENHVIIQWNIGYWQWVCISVPVMLCPKWLKEPAGGAVIGVAMIAQTLYWLGLMSLPLIKQ